MCILIILPTLEVHQIIFKEAVPKATGTVSIAKGGNMIQ